MAEKYMVDVRLASMRRGETEWSEVVDTEELPERLGEHELFTLILAGPRGNRRITITAKVEKYPLPRYQP